MAFSETLRRLRLERFFSQAELARRSGVRALTVTRLESGWKVDAPLPQRVLSERLQRRLASSRVSLPVPKRSPKPIDASVAAS